MSKVRDLLRQLPASVPADTPIATVARYLGGAAGGPLAVVTPCGKYLGLIRLRDVLEVLSDNELARLVTAADLVQPGADFVATEDSLEDALERFASTEADALAVVGQKEDSGVVGFIARRDLLLACARKRRFAASAPASRRCGRHRMQGCRLTA